MNFNNVKKGGLYYQQICNLEQIEQCVYTVKSKIYCSGVD